MKGLFLKDLYTLRKYYVIFLAAELLIMISASLANDSSYMMILGVVLLNTVPMGLISYDERDKWNSYVDVLPYKRSQVVSEKYALSLIANCIYIALTMINFIAINVAKGTFDPSLTAAIFMILLSACLIFPSITMFLVFWLGCEKGRVFSVVLVCGFSAVMGVLMAITIGEEETTEGAALAFNNIGWNLPVLGFILLGCIALYATSWILSMSVYKKREL